MPITPLVFDDDFCAHQFVLVAAKIVAKKIVLSCLGRGEFHDGGFSRRKIGADIEVGDLKSVRKIQRGKFQGDRFIRFQDDFIGRIGKPLGNDLHHPRIGGVIRANGQPKDGKRGNQHQGNANRVA